VSGRTPLGPLWMGIDLGTGGVRALLVDDHGTVRGRGEHRLRSGRRGRRHEQDPEGWWRGVVAACRQALRDVAADRVAGVAADATSGTVVLTDATGRPLTPGLMYDDDRAVEQLRRVNQEGEAVWRGLGYHRMQTSWALPKLLWLVEQDPGLADTARLMHQVDLVNRRLVGRDVPTDLTSALKTGADVMDEVWPSAVMESLGVPMSMLPGLVRSGTRIGAVGKEAAALTGIPAGTPVAAGATDGCAAQLGAGTVQAGAWNSVLGTTLVVKGVAPTPVADPLGAVYSHRAPNGDWFPGGASSTGSGLLSRRFAGADLDALSRAAAAGPPSELVAYPLGGTSERFPFVAPEAEAFVLGTPRDDVDLYQALLQGEAYLERLCFDYLHLLGAPVDGRLTTTGGATRSHHWCQVRADVLGRPLTVPATSEPALGAAVLAAGDGRDLAEVASGMVRVGRTVEPRARYAERHGRHYLLFIDELERRGWLPEAVATHARDRARR
jgi:sugar (pentulose or hexulose) kinase